MKHKYIILKDIETKSLIIKEYAELDKDTMKFLCEESYPDKKIKSVIPKGKGALISILRTVNFYPSGFYANKLAEAVIEYYLNKSAEPVEIFFNDVETIPKDKVKEKIPPAVIEAESADVDELIEDEFEEEYKDSPEIKKINSSLTVANEDEFDDFDQKKH
jgi:hypothetical protein